jgi:serine/threonine protein kinase
MVGSSIKHYKIIEKLGEGGMGVVYKAHDTKLDRFVALKFFPPHLAASEQDKARFTQEAQSASALNHPNVCTIHDIQEHDGQIFIVMECIDGVTLQEKKSSLTVKQAIDYGIQIAEGLAAAHEKGVVHRDIKPENIMIRKDGIAQIMDFGLAKLRGASRLTKEGSTVGTAGYMSPEQVQGHDVDNRSDIFSYGVLLYEMLTGTSPFKGGHESAILYEIVNVDVPPPSTVKAEIDPELDRIVMDCMEKDPNERTQSIKQVAIDLNKFKRTSSRSRLSRSYSTVSTPGPPTLSAGRGLSGAGVFVMRHLPWLITAAVTLGALAWALWLHPKKDDAGRLPGLLNLTAVSSPDQTITHTEIPCLTISPDGRIVVYTISEGGASQLYLRTLDSYQPVPIKGTLNGTAPFFSPDGQWIGFAADGKIKKVPASGGTVEVVCDASGFRGASWGPDNRIYYSPTYASGLLSVSSLGGEVRAFTTLDSTRRERTHRWPQVTPDGKWVIYTLGDRNNPNSYVDGTLVMQSIAGSERHVLDVRGEMARYIEPGYLVVARNGMLLVAPFSMKTFRTTRPLVARASEVNVDPGSGATDFAISASGHLVYLPGSLNKELELIWVTRDGKITPMTLPPQPYVAPRISPDGTKIAFCNGLVAGNETDIWIIDLKKNALNRLTFGKKMFDPIWSRDGKMIYYAEASDGLGGVMVRPSDGSSDGSLVIPNQSQRFQYPSALTPDGKQLIFNEYGGASDGDVEMLDLEKRNGPTPLFTGPAFEYGGTLSPDGRFITYGSNETGTLEIYVRSYPDLKGKWQVSIISGSTPVWSHDGREIFYVSTIGKMMAVPVRTSPAFSADQPRELFDVSQMYFPSNPTTNFDVTTDGQRFIMVRSSRTNPTTASLNYVLNWTRELQRDIPVDE